MMYKLNENMSQSKLEKLWVFYLEFRFVGEGKWFSPYPSEFLAKASVMKDRSAREKQTEVY